MTTVKHADRGKWAEGKIMKWLEGRSTFDMYFAYHRFSDARAARGALAGPPL